MSGVEVLTGGGSGQGSGSAGGKGDVLHGLEDRGGRWCGEEVEG